MVLAHNLKEKDRTNDVQISRDVTFESMLLSSQTLKGLKNSGFYRPSPVQLLGIPLGKCGFDLLLEAKSGTGKTAVFSVIALEKIDLRKSLQVVILAPTREIAAQICDVLRQIGSKYEGLHVEVVMGGLPVQDDIIKFNKDLIHIVVGSPGRLKHLISDKHIDVSAVRLLVLDEADKLMEKSFLSDIKYIYSTLPKQKQVIMSSATYPDSSKEFIDQFVYSAQHICPNSNSVLLGVVQKITSVQYNSNIVKQTQNRFNELVKILTKIQFKQCLIFCNYQTRVAELHKMLIRNKWPAEQLHGQQDQIDRLDALKTLQEYKCRILISTDLASRGIDASNIDLVINFEPPFEWQTYLHRIGRAGRFGSYGTAITILSEGTEKKKLMKLIESLNAPLNDLWNNEDIIDEDNVETSCTENLLVKEIESSTQSELWKTICPDETNCSTDGVASFDQLCCSFNITKKYVESQNIQSFSDLFQSYTKLDNNFDQNSLQYHCLGIPEKPDKNFLISKPLSTVENNGFNSINKIIEEGLSGIDCNVLIDENKKQPKEIAKTNADITTQMNGEFCIKQDLDNEVQTIENENSDKSSLPVVDKTNIKDSTFSKLTYSNLNNELDLPTAFMSAKDKRRNEHFRKLSNQRHKEHHEPIKLWSYNQPLCKHNSESRHNENKEKNKHQTKYRNNRDCDSDLSFNSKVGKKSTVSYKIGNNKSDINKAYGSNPNKIHFSENQEHSCGVRNMNTSYYNWYNQLKLRARQVELNTYIKELSEL